MVNDVGSSSGGGGLGNTCTRTCSSEGTRRRAAISPTTTGSASAHHDTATPSSASTSTSTSHYSHHHSTSLSDSLPLINNVKAHAVTSSASTTNSFTFRKRKRSRRHSLTLPSVHIQRGRIPCLDTSSSSCCCCCCIIRSSKNKKRQSLSQQKQPRQKQNSTIVQLLLILAFVACLWTLIILHPKNYGYVFSKTRITTTTATATVASAASASASTTSSFHKGAYVNNNNNTKHLRIMNHHDHHHHHHHHIHAIPNILLFTHRYPLLNMTLTELHNVAANQPDEYTELVALQHNIRHTIELHSQTAEAAASAQVRFLTDPDCVRSIQTVLPHLRQSRMPKSSSSSNNNNNATTSTTTTTTKSLVDYFLQEQTGMFKADLCRGVALWETGGLYFDADLGVRQNLWQVLFPQTRFATVRVHAQSHHKGAFFQAFMAATPQHAVLTRYIELFWDYYDGKLPQLNGKPLGVVLLKRAFDEIVAQQKRQHIVGTSHRSRSGDDDDEDEEEKDSHQVQQSEELQGPLSTATATATTQDDVQNDITISIADTTEIWQEVLYLPELQKTLLSHVPPPTWGTRRACKFIVVANTEFPVTVPFYSRIAGSRMCPAHEQHQQQHQQEESDGEGIIEQDES